MDILVWILTGAAVGWATYAFLGFNAQRGAYVSMLLGAVGALIGGKAIAPMFIAVPAGGGASTSGVLFAALVAGAVLLLGNLVYERWGV